MIFGAVGSVCANTAVQTFAICPARKQQVTSVRLGRKRPRMSFIGLPLNECAAQETTGARGSLSRLEQAHSQDEYRRVGFDPYGQGIVSLGYNVVNPNLGQPVHSAEVVHATTAPVRHA